MLLCRHYVRKLKDTVLQDYDEIDEYGAPGYVTIRKEVVTRSDIKVSALKILYTYVVPGAEREIELPTELSNTLTDEVEMNERCDPDVFDAAKDWVFQAMERYAFPGFLNLGRPLFKIFRKSTSLGPLVNRLVLGGASTTAGAGMRATADRRLRSPPGELFESDGVA